MLIKLLINLIINPLFTLLAKTWKILTTLHGYLISCKVCLSVTKNICCWTATAPHEPFSHWDFSSTDKKSCPTDSTYTKVCVCTKVYVWGQDLCVCVCLWCVKWCVWKRPCGCVCVCVVKFRSWGIVRGGSLIKTYTSTHTHTHIHTHTHTQTHTHTHTHTHINTLNDTSRYTHTHAPTHRLTQTQLAQTHTDTHTHTHINTQTHTHIHTHTATHHHTQTHTRQLCAVKTGQDLTYKKKLSSRAGHFRYFLFFNNQ